jgi:hypothetical protein
METFRPDYATSTRLVVSDRPGSEPTARRVRDGKRREAQIANALREQHGLDLRRPTDSEDRYEKIDRWLVTGDGRRLAVQVKYRQTGEDLLVEVYDKWYGWDDPKNKVGRDVTSPACHASLYAVLRSDRRTVVMVETRILRRLVEDMIVSARVGGWTSDYGPSAKTLRYFQGGCRAELKVMTDPADGRPKMVAYIPSAMLVGQARTYLVRLPKNWQE